MISNNKGVLKNRPLLQVQPAGREYSQWMALSLREGLFFEPLEPAMMPGSAESGEMEKMLERYRESGRVTSLHGAFIDVNPASGDPDFRLLSVKRCRESCAIAKSLGAQNVVFHASAHPFLRGAYIENWAAVCADLYMELSGTYGLGIRVENSQDMDPAPLETLMKRVSAGDVAVCLDVGHAHYSRASMESWFGALGEHIKYMHLSDNIGRFDDHLPIGRGNVDWEKVSVLWERLDRPMPMTLEVGDVCGAEESVAWLRERGLFGLKERDPDEC